MDTYNVLSVNDILYILILFIDLSYLYINLNINIFNDISFYIWVVIIFIKLCDFL